MKPRKIYSTYKEINIKQELKKKYNVQECMLTGHIPAKLYPARIGKRVESKLH